MRQQFLFELFSKQVTFDRWHNTTQFPTQLFLMIRFDENTGKGQTAQQLEQP